MKIKCIVACKNANGSPDFYPCEIEATKKQRNNGEHYQKATDLAADKGYEGEMVAYDEKDGPAFLFEQFFPQKFAKVAWMPSDVKTIRPKWSMLKCEEQLAANAKYVQDGMIEVGWEILKDILDK